MTTETDPPRNWLRFTFEALLVCVSVWQIAQLLQVWSLRVAYPYDLEWMEGATLISSLRVTQGLPLYGLPDATYIPFIYPPLYAWVVAGLSLIFPFGYTIGRAVSIAGTLLSASALLFGAREAGARWPIALGCVAVFLGTWEETGTFLDLVRIDGLSIALIGWALVLAVGRTPQRAIAGGLMLALAFTCKHHAAIFGFPIALALLLRDGPRRALQFGLSAMIPALLFVGVMQLTTDGRFLLWLVDVPANHGIVADRLLPTIAVSSWSPFKYQMSGASLEVVAAMPLVWLVGVGMVVVAVTRDVREARLGGSLARLFAGLLVLGGIANVVLYNTPFLWKLLSGGFGVIGIWCVIAILATIGLLTVLWRAGTPLATSPRFFYWAFLTMIGLGVVSLMRGHVGGFTNVLIPMMWIQSLWLALLVGRAGQGFGGVALTAVLALQVVLGRSDNYQREIPTAEDVRRGDELIEELRALPGPILLPHAPYYAVLAGHDPSFALITLWDISDDGVPREAGRSAIKQLFADRHWKSGVFPGGKPGSGVEGAYKRAHGLRHQGPPTKTGWAVRLRDVWTIKAEGEPDEVEVKPKGGKAGK